MKKSNLKKLVMMTLAMGALYIPSMASAEEAAAPQEFALDEVVVTANRMENKLVDTPANVAVVTAEEIERRNYQDAIEAVKNVPGVNVTSGARGDQSYISINGDVRVLVMVDGRRINTDRGVTSGRANFDAALLPNPNMIERIEILKGGASTVYGSDAVAGVINIITKSANKNYVKLDVNTGSWGAQNYKAIISHKEEKTGVLATVSKEKQNYTKYKEANTNEHKKLENSKYDKVTANIKVEQEIDENQMITLYYEHSHKDGGRPGVANVNDYYNHSSTANGSDLSNNVSLKYDWGLKSENTGHIQIFRNYARNEYFNSLYNWCTVPETKVGVELQQKIKTSENNSLLVGAEYNNSKVDYKGSMDPYNNSINNKAVFIQDSWKVNDTLTLNTGLRYNNHSTAGSKTTASAAINKKFDETSHVYFSWNQVFNTPHTDDLFSSGGGMYGNRNLKAETGNVYTLGYESKLGRKSQAGVNAFYSKLNNAIGWLDKYNSTGDWEKSDASNIDKQTRRGFELNYKYSFNDNWSVNASYAYVKVENKYGNLRNDKNIRDYNVLPNQYKLGISYTDDRWNIDLYGRGASGGAFSGTSAYGTSYRPYADSKYLTLDLSVNYKVKENWKFYVKGYNLTNVAYAERATTYQSGGESVYNYPAAGRRFLVGTQITF